MITVKYVDITFSYSIHKEKHILMFAQLLFFILVKMCNCKTNQFATKKAYNQLNILPNPHTFYPEVSTVCVTFWIYGTLLCIPSWMALHCTLLYTLHCTAPTFIGLNCTALQQPSLAICSSKNHPENSRCKATKHV